MTRSAQGEDRSNFQAVGPWRDLDFGWCKATEGVSFIDPTFAPNWANLKAQAGYRGAYHFFHPGIDPLAQAEHFMGIVIRQGLEPGDMLAIDAEIAAGADGTQLLAPAAYRRSDLLYADAQGRARIHPRVSYPHRFLRPSMPRKITAALVGSTALQFLLDVQFIASSHVGGDYCPIFCYSFVSFLPQLASCTRYPLWVASFASSAPQSVAPWGKWTQWQYAGGGGQLGSDQDAFNGTRADMDTWMSAYQPGRKPPPQPPAPNWTEQLVQALPQLSKNATGNDVKTVQALLIARGHAVKIDGIFGAGTDAAVREFQLSAGLKKDGIVGKLTWTKLLNR